MSISSTLRPPAVSIEHGTLYESDKLDTPSAHFPTRDARKQRTAKLSYSAARSDTRQVIPLPLGIEARSLLAPKQVELNYRGHVDELLPQPCGAQFGEAILVNGQEEEMGPATLHAVDDKCILIETEQPWSACNRGAQLLIFLPTTPQRLDAMRVTVHDMQSPTRFTVLCQDRRGEARHYLQLLAPIQMRLVPPDMVTALSQQQMRLVRHLAFPSRRDQGIEHSYINDILCTDDGNEPAGGMQHLDADIPLLCYVHDMSPGGLAVLPPAEREVEALVNRLVFLQMTLPYVACGVTKVHFTLQLFGFIRALSQHATPNRLHLRFLHRLPDEMSAVFAHLERRYLHHQTPLE